MKDNDYFWIIGFCIMILLFVAYAFWSKNIFAAQYELGYQVGYTQALTEITKSVIGAKCG